MGAWLAAQCYGYAAGREKGEELRAQAGNLLVQFMMPAVYLRTGMAQVFMILLLLLLLLLLFHLYCLWLLLPSVSYQDSAAAATAELLKRQEELNRKAEELDRRERELQNAALAGGAARPNNWPPLPSFCPVKPCFYQDIPVEIPVESQKTVTTMYYLWMASIVTLFFNFLASLALFCVDTSGGSGFGLSILWALIFTPCSFLCWYRPMYKAFKSDSSFNFFVFFFIFFAQDVVFVLQAIGIPGWGFSGWIVSLSALKLNTAVAVLMMLVAIQFTAVAGLGIIMLKRIHSLYRRTGASFQKAQEEFAAGVFSNQAVRTAAANAAAGAATSTFRAA
uniref:Secretory carrier-associated membrane protein n=1 Tax=Anolis carolinensis TaxID=28377 RepID=A0A803SWW7_ANOCA